MNEWPDELWQNERSRMWATLALSASDVDAETDDSQYTIESTVPWVVLGACLTLSLSVAMASVVAMAGLRRTRKRLRRRAIGFAPVVRHTS